jgi:glutathione S-transferase
VTRWLNWESAHWTPSATPLAFERVVKKLAGLGEPNPAEVARGELLFHREAPVLNTSLRGKKFMLGERVTIADFAVATGMVFADAAQFPLEKYDEIVRWYDAFRVLPGWQKSLIPPQS